MKTQITKFNGVDVGDIIARSEYKDKPYTATQKLVSFINMSEICNAGKINGVICCIWGLIPPSLLSDRAYLWLMTTEQMTEHQFILVRHSQVEIEKMLEEYNVIIGHCSPQQPKSVRWLKWLGAKFFDMDSLGRLPFEIRRDEWIR